MFYACVLCSPREEELGAHAYYYLLSYGNVTDTEVKLTRELICDVSYGKINFEFCR